MLDKLISNKYTRVRKPVEEQISMKTMLWRELIVKDEVGESKGGASIADVRERVQNGGG